MTRPIVPLATAAALAQWAVQGQAVTPGTHLCATGCAHWPTWRPFPRSGRWSMGCTTVAPWRRSPDPRQLQVLHLPGHRLRGGPRTRLGRPQRPRGGGGHLCLRRGTQRCTSPGTRLVPLPRRRPRRRGGTTVLFARAMEPRQQLPGQRASVSGVCGHPAVPPTPLIASLPMAVAASTLSSATDVATYYAITAVGPAGPSPPSVSPDGFATP